MKTKMMKNKKMTYTETKKKKLKKKILEMKTNTF